MKINKRVVFTLLFMLIFVGGVYAQDVPPERVDHEVVISIIINTVGGLVIAAFGSSPATLVITSILKKIEVLDRFPAEHLQFATASVLFIIAMIASATGYQVEFESVLELIAVVGPALIAFIGTLIGSKAMYHGAKALDAPVVGKSRSDDQVTWVA